MKFYRCWNFLSKKVRHIKIGKVVWNTTLCNKQRILGVILLVTAAVSILSTQLCMVLLYYSFFQKVILLKTCKSSRKHKWNLWTSKTLDITSLLKNRYNRLKIGSHNRTQPGRYCSHLVSQYDVSLCFKTLEVAYGWFFEELLCPRDFTYIKIRWSKIYEN